ncbi:protein kinase, partial [Streptomyces sp. SID10853]|uniref:protein kinase domain-containing protein n=1 Tax=Streptomyces sp. SID10853 TaxID=2706028 RepID=UPI001EF28D7F
PAPSDGARPAAVLLPPPDKDHDPLVLPEVRPAAPVAGPYDAARLRGLGLGPDRMLAGQYRLIRSIGYGGMGEVHLAEDTRLENRPVALKFLHQQHDGDPDSARHPDIRLGEKAMRSERQELVALNHPDLIRVFNYGSHDPAGEFLVLEYANGLTLEEVRVRVVNDPGSFGGVRFHEFVLGYGIRILNALSYLHQQKGKVYGDLKPHNVMHCGTEIKIVDVGSVRRERAEGPVTVGYFAPGVGPHGESRFQDDLFSLGVTLRELSAAAPPAQGLGPESLRRALDHATHADRRARFATADEMALQLRGVLRELRSLRTSRESFEPSPLFVQSAHALDGAIGSPPPLSRWASGAAPPAPLGPVPPEPGEMACGLPVPKPDPHDRHGRRDGAPAARGAA